jgi:hypothetical protein
VYEDHAQRDSNWVGRKKEENDAIAEKKSAGGAKETFPIKLHAMLERVDELGLNAIVSWLPHGRAFKVRVESCTLATRDAMRYQFSHTLSIIQGF